MTTRDSAIGTFLFLLIFMGACGDSTTPDSDNIPPTIDLNMQAYLRDVACPMSVSFYLDPGSCSDDVTSKEDLKLRWDFDNDGEWDTEFGPVESIVGHDPHPLPVTIWDVRCEVQDAAGNSTVIADSLVLPDWIAVPPDIVIGEMTISTDGDIYADVDTLHAGETFRVNSWRSDWINESDLSIVQRLYLDNQLVEEWYGSTGYPHSHLCARMGGWFPDGLTDLGAHEFKVEVEIEGGFVETNSTNNTATKIFYVVE